MLRLRRDQMQIFEDRMQQLFEERMTTHLKEYFPQETASLTDVDLLQIVRYGVARAGSYGFLSEADVCRYLNLMLTFGRDFDVDSRLDWVQDILQYEDEPERKMKRLYATALGMTHVASGFAARQEVPA